jgi:manganese efflux pump family protein
VGDRTVGENRMAVGVGSLTNPRLGVADTSAGLRRRARTWQAARVLSALILSFALAADATAVAAVRGLLAKHVRWREALLLAGLFGGFQGGMAALGWLAGAGLGRWVAQYDHWIAFTLLAGLGLKVLWEAWRGDDDDAEDAEAAANPFALGPLLVMSVATSIDALAAGVTLPLLPTRPAVSLARIAGVTFAASLVAVELGRRLGARFRAGVEVVGGLALVGLGVKILVEHLAA